MKMKHNKIETLLSAFLDGELVVRVAHVGEVGVNAPHDLGGQMNVDVALGA